MSALFSYKELHTFDGTNQTLVLSEITQRIYLKKTLDVYNLSVFQFLKTHPHPHIPRVVDFYEENGKLAVIEQYIQGDTLDVFLARTNPPEEERRRILYDVCDAVAFLHSADPPVIHRDIKMANIMLDERGTVYLVDYDAAKIRHVGETRDTTLIGTEGHAAPEQYGFGASDERTDIYALGVLIRQMMPQTDRYRSIADRCTQLDPARRYASVGMLMAALMMRPAGRGVAPDRGAKPGREAVPGRGAMPDRGEVPGRGAMPDREEMPGWGAMPGREAVPGREVTAGSGLNRDERSGPFSEPRTGGLFPPPGFRSGVPAHMIIAVIGYVVIVFFNFTMTFRDVSGTAELWMNRVFLFLSALAGVDIWTSWTHIYDSLPGMYDRRTWVRIAVRILYSILAVIVAAFLCGVFQALLFR